MKVHLIKKQSIEDYVVKNARARASFEIWLSILKRADWNEPNEIVSTFNKVDIIGKGTNRVVFNIGGNNYWMICKYDFGALESTFSFSVLGHTQSIRNFAMKVNSL